MKRCYRCTQERPEDDFCADKSRKDGLNPQCRACAAIAYKALVLRGYEKGHRRARKYGLSLDQMRSLLDGAACAICSGPSECIDHDHATGVVRGVLCRPCNLVLGMMQDDPARLTAAADYLRRH